MSVSGLCIPIPASASLPTRASHLPNAPESPDPPVRRPQPTRSVHHELPPIHAAAVNLMKHRLMCAATAAAAGGGGGGTPLRRHVPHAAQGLRRRPHAALGREVELLKGDCTPAAACDGRSIVALAACESRRARARPHVGHAGYYTRSCCPVGRMRGRCRRAGPVAGR